MAADRGIVTSPDGVRWRVRRRWLDRPLPSLRNRWSGKRGEKALERGLDVASAGEFVDNIWVTVAGIVVIAVAVFILLPLLGLAFEFVLVFLLLSSGILGRLLLDRPWIVEAAPEGETEDHTVFAVKGWRRSNEALRELRTAISAGAPPETIADARRQATRPAVASD
jgi:hypothetical protein